MTEHLSKDYRIYSPSYLLQQWFYIAYQRQDNRMEKLGKYRFQYLLLHFAHCIFYMSVRIGPTFLLVLLSCLFVSHIEVHQASSSFTISWSLLKTMSIETVMPSNHLILCCPLLLLLSIFPNQGLFQWVGSLRQVAKVLELQHQSCNEYSGLISFRIDWVDLLAVSRFIYSSTVRKHQFFGAQPSLWPNSHVHTWLLEKP